MEGTDLTPKAALACPRCGCPGSEVIRTRLRADERQRERQCDHCRRRFWTSEKPVVKPQGSPP
jgi:transcriptional regulator NrdR family protein